MGLPLPGFSSGGGDISGGTTSSESSNDGEWSNGFGDFSYSPNKGGGISGVTIALVAVAAAAIYLYARK